MTPYKITAELNLGKIVAESREVAQALNEFADNLERIEKKYAESQKSCDTCKHKDDGWGSEPCDGCCGNHSGFEPQESDHKCHTCKHYTSGENDGSCDSYICKGYSDWESEGE